MVVHASIQVRDQRRDQVQRRQDRLLHSLCELLPNVVRFSAVTAITVIAISVAAITVVAVLRSVVFEL